MNEKDFKIYTRQGDKGKTSLLGGTKVPKYHHKIEAYGTVDELNSYIGLVMDQDIDEHAKKVLGIIQEKLFVAEAILASDKDDNLDDLPPITGRDVEFLENAIDKMNEKLPVLHNFILPGGHTLVSFCHIARCVCRRAERCAIKCCEGKDAEEMVIKYLNRLSDYLFVFGRKIGHDLNIKERIWKI
jgi:cob(I)alamin adenosyltransferase